MVAPVSGFPFLSQFTCCINFDAGVYIFPHSDHDMLRRQDLVHFPENRAHCGRIKEINDILLYSHRAMEAGRRNTFCVQLFPSLSEAHQPGCRIPDTMQKKSVE